MKKSLSLLLDASMTPTMSPYTPRMPAIITGTTDFRIRSGFSTPIEQIPTPLFAVPYADPRSMKGK